MVEILLEGFSLRPRLALDKIFCQRARRGRQNMPGVYKIIYGENVINKITDELSNVRI